MATIHDERFEGFCSSVDNEHGGGFGSSIRRQTESSRVSLDEVSLEATRFQQLQQVMEKVIGSQVVVKVVNNKLAPPFKNAEFELEFGKGISGEGEIIDLATKHKLVTKSVAIYSFNDKKLHGKEAFKRYLAENGSALEELESCDETWRKSYLMSQEVIAATPLHKAMEYETARRRRNSPEERTVNVNERFSMALSSRFTNTISVCPVFIDKDF
ncbi:protein RecA-like [Hibiscus syriacus]|uniref:protein RecA-like n=1 Tax=Hibiscus syriacus TaxID=106335 RepID=UPI0019206381|nr:protein RecA-like [Hibiscus syriacus]